MNKNTAIGLLLAVVVIGGGYLIYKNKAAPTGDYQAPVTSTPAPSDQTPATTPPANTPPVTFTPSIPTVTTGSNTTVSSSTAIVTGSVTPNGAPVSYWFDYGTSTAFGSKTPAQNLGSGYTTINTPAYITGLKPSTTYYYRLSAMNAFGTVNGSNYSFVTNTNPPPTGKAPTVRTSSASGVSHTTANVGGQVTPNGATTNYWFEYGTTTGLGSITTIQTLGSTSSATNVSDSLDGLSPLTRYYFRLNAQNQFGTIIGSTLSFTTSGPVSVAQPAVATTAASNVGTTTAHLNGHVAANGGETTYWFEYSTDSVLGSIIGSGTTPEKLSSGSGTTNVSAATSGLAKNTTYYYRIVARNSAGEVKGNIMSFKTKS